MSLVKFYHIESYIEYPVGVSMKVNKHAITLMADKIKEVFPNQEINFWCRGSSGAIIAGVICGLVLNSIISYVRKEHESAHSSATYSVNPNRVNIIVDDLVASGKTIEIIKTYMNMNGLNVDCLCIGGHYDLESREFDYTPILICRDVYYKKSYYEDAIIES